MLLISLVYECRGEPRTRQNKTDRLVGGMKGANSATEKFLEELICFGVGKFRFVGQSWGFSGCFLVSCVKDK